MADFYGTLAGALAYHADRGNAAWGASSDPLRTAALVRASEYVDLTYIAIFPGLKTGEREQVRQWPRTGANDQSGYAIPDDEVPVEIENATYEGALRELASPGSLNPDVKAGGGIVKRVRAGSTEVEFAVTSATTATFSRIENILAPLIARRSAYSGSVSRA